MQQNEKRKSQGTNRIGQIRAMRRQHKEASHQSSEKIAAQSYAEFELFLSEKPERFMDAQYL